MAIPDTQQPFPQRSRPVYVRGKGLSQRFTLQTIATQGVPNDPAEQVQHFALVSGSRTVTISPPNPIVVDVPLQGLSTPFTTSSSISMTADAPVITLPEGVTLGSVEVAPMVVLAGQSTTLGASTIGRGMKIKRFLVRVTLHLGNFSAAGQSATVSVSARLFSQVV